MKFALPCFITVVFVVGCGPGWDRGEISTAKTNRIYDGTLAAADSPIRHSAVQIIVVRDEKDFGCSGNVLSPNLILTAGHCLLRYAPLQPPRFDQPSQVNVVDEAGSLHTAKAYKINPRYLDSLGKENYFSLWTGYDAAVIQLEEPLSSFFEPVILRDDVATAMKETLFVAGFGKSSNDPEALWDDQLRIGPAQFDPKNRVLYSLGWTESQNGKSTVKLEFKSGAANSPFARSLQYRKSAATAGVCKGDSGGPIYFQRDKRIHLVGIHSNILGGRICSAIAGDVQDGAALNNDLLRFIADAVREMSNITLPGLENLPSSADDPTSFDYYFATAPTPARNNSIDLENTSLVLEGANKLGAFPRLILGGNKTMPCAGVVQQFYEILELLTPETADGKNPMLLRKVVVKDGSGQVEQHFEARVKFTNGLYQVVILTPDGFVGKTYPPGPVCNF